MLARIDNTAAREYGNDDHAGPEGPVPAPLFGREKYERLVAGLIADLAPRMFAVVQDYGDRVDSRVAAWGLAFDDYTEIVGVDRDLRISAASPEQALIGFAHQPDITARVIWVHLGPPEDADVIDSA